MPFVVALLLTLFSVQAAPCPKRVTPAGLSRASRVQSQRTQTELVAVHSISDFQAYSQPAIPSNEIATAWAERAVAFQIPPPSFSL